MIFTLEKQKGNISSNDNLQSRIFHFFPFSTNLLVTLPKAISDMSLFKIFPNLIAN